MGDVKKEVDVKPENLDNEKQEENRLLKELYAQIFQSITEANLSSLKSIELAQQLSSIREDNDDIVKQFHEVITPLKNTVDAFGLSLSALHIIGKAFFSIEDYDTDMKQDEIKHEPPAKDEEEGDNLSDAGAYFPYNGDFVEYSDTEDGQNEYDEKFVDSEGSFKCDMCDYSTTEARYLKQHKQRHEAGRYKCELCDYATHKPYVLKTHIRQVHEIKSIEYICERENPDVRHYLCQKCHYANTDQEALDAHIESKHTNVSIVNGDYDNEEKAEAVKQEEEMEEDDFDPHDVGNQYACTRCDYVAKKRLYLEDHLNGGRKFTKCPWCDSHYKITHGKGKLGRHLTTAHGRQRVNDRWVCSDCGQELDRLRYFLHHMAKVHKIGTMLHCDQCQYSSYDRQNLIHHAKDHDVASHPCPQCSHMAKSKARLTKHIYDTHKKMDREKNASRPLCTICGKSFHSTGALGTHVKGMHSAEKLQCENCEYTTHNQHNLTHHMKTRHLEKKFLCDQCDYSTSSKSLLGVHIKGVHMKVRYNCDICDKEFIADSSLRRHKEVKHSANSAKFPCKEPGCEYTTHSSYNLRMHVERVHEGIRWPCDMCDYVGGYKGDLTRHKKIVHEGHILSCSLCQFKTPKKFHLKEHMLKEHSLELE